MTVTDLLFNEYNSYYQSYLDQIDEDLDLISGLKKGKKRTIAFFDSLPEDKLLFRYAEGKWTVKEVLQHLIDTERVFAYRAFRIGRGDVKPLASFDQDAYIEPSGANEKSRIELLDEYDLVRRNTISLVKSLPERHLMNIGIASAHPLSARAAAFVNIGHEIWHMKIIEERYL